jgi:hypothetical protein
MHGIHIGAMPTQNHTITQNTCINNTVYAISRGIFSDISSFYNEITSNILVDNREDAEDLGNYNLFDYNYWSDYSGVDADQDGIGDTSYAIIGDAGSSDPHPLMFLPTPPAWDYLPANQTITDIEVLDYDLNITSPSPVNWSVDDTVHFTIDENGTLHSEGTLAIGEYGLTVTVKNIYNYSIWAELTVTVLPWDTTPPSWDALPDNQIVEYGDSFSYDLNATDPTGISHWWLNSTDFTIDAEGTIENATILSVNVYGLEIYVNDTYSNIQSATISISVKDTIAPVWVTLQIQHTIDYGESLQIDVEAWDLDGIDHLWLNDTTHFILDGNTIRNATLLASGEYILEVRAYDLSNNYCSAALVITVLEEPTPTTTPTPTDTTSPTTPTGTTPGGFDLMMILAIGGGIGAIVILVIIVFLKKKS